ncbi:MAG TPA: hypothetical protein VNP71_00910 [Thermoplasmata archaeon]|nr:hypothetical protein [Thermoplasmata archaeon]
MKPDSPENPASVVRSQLEAWMAELEVLSRDPRVRKFAELRQKIDEVDSFLDEAPGPPAPSRSSPFQPYDAYDAYEFGRDLAGRELSTLELSKLAQGRFPEWSNESRRFMVQYLIANGVAEVARTTAAGRPIRYRFGALGNGRVAGRRMRFGVPDNELSAFKGEDMEDLVLGVPSAGLIRVRPQARASPTPSEGAFGASVRIPADPV